MDIAKRFCEKNNHIQSYKYIVPTSKNHKHFFLNLQPLKEFLNYSCNFYFFMGIIQVCIFERTSVFHTFIEGLFPQDGLVLPILSIYGNCNFTKLSFKFFKKVFYFQFFTFMKCFLCLSSDTKITLITSKILLTSGNIG